MMLAYHAFLKYAKTVAQESGISVVIEADATVPRTDGSTIYMPLPDLAAAEGSDKYNKWWRSFIHEINHIKHKGDFKTLKDNDIQRGSLLGFALNIVVDHNIDKAEYGKYDGRDILSDRGYEIGVTSNINNLINDERPEISAIFALNLDCRNEWENIKVEYELPPLTASKYELIKGYKEELKAIRKDGKPNLDLAIKLLTAMGITDEQIKSDMQKPKSSGEASESAGEGEESAKVIAGGEVNYKDIEHIISGDSDAGVPVKIRYDGVIAPSKDGYVPNKYIIKTPDDISRQHRREHYVREISEAVAKSNLSTTIKQELKILSQVRKHGGKTTGRLHRKAITKVAARTTSRVFENVTHKDILDTAVTLLVDESGSMNGRKFTIAAASATILSDVLSNININHEIVGFTEEYGENVYSLHKEFNKSVTADNLIDQFSRSRLSNNPDGDALLFVYERIKLQRNKRKIIIVLSDGQPCAGHEVASLSYGVVQAQWLKYVTTQIESSPIELYSIGIEDASVKYFYKNHKVIKNATELESALLTLLKTVITN